MLKWKPWIASLRPSPPRNNPFPRSLSFRAFFYMEKGTEAHSFALQQFQNALLRLKGSQSSSRSGMRIRPVSARSGFSSDKDCQIFFSLRIYGPKSGIRAGMHCLDQDYVDKMYTESCIFKSLKMSLILACGQDGISGKQDVFGPLVTIEIFFNFRNFLWYY